MTVRRKIAFQNMFRVSSFKFQVFGACFLTTRNQKRETRNSVLLQRSGSVIAAEAFMNNAG